MSHRVFKPKLHKHLSQGDFLQTCLYNITFPLPIGWVTELWLGDFLSIPVSTCQLWWGWVWELKLYLTPIQSGFSLVPSYNFALKEEN